MQAHVALGIHRIDVRTRIAVGTASLGTRYLWKSMLNPPLGFQLLLACIEWLHHNIVPSDLDMPMEWRTRRQRYLGTMISIRLAWHVFVIINILHSLVLVRFILQTGIDTI